MEDPGIMINVIYVVRDFVKSTIPRSFVAIARSKGWSADNSGCGNLLYPNDFRYIVSKIHFKLKVSVENKLQATIHTFVAPITMIIKTKIDMTIFRTYSLAELTNITTTLINMTM
jgi:hypothetical protein